MWRLSNLQRRSTWIVAAIVLLLACPALAIDIQVNYGDGFDDPTFGASRTAAFEAAIEVWEAELQGSVVVRVNASWDDEMDGGSDWAVLGGAGANTIHRDFTGATLGSTWYAQALANQLRGSDLDGDEADIVAMFNPNVDGDVILGTTHWYYGLDGNPPGNDIDFFTTVLHELGHGLGFFDLVDPDTGAWVHDDFPGAYGRHLTHNGVGAFTALSNAQRKTALTSGNVYWTGANAVAEMSGNVKMYAPSPYENGSSISHWDTSHFPNLLMEPFDTVPIHGVDLTREAFMDIGWSVAAEVPGEIDIAENQALLVNAEGEWIFAAHWNSVTSTFQFLGDWRIGGASTEIFWYPVPDDQTCSVWIYSATTGGYVKAFQYILYAAP